MTRGTTARWTPADIPDLSGRIALVTGGNRGLGLETAAMLASRGAEVVIACRNASAATEALSVLEARAPMAHVAAMNLDLARLSSVRDFTRAFAARHDRLDILVNNAGVFGINKGLTEDGFELHFGTNHLGHFAMTLGLMESLARSPAPRIVAVTSMMARQGKIDFDNLDRRKGKYSKWQAYSDSKLANALFAGELQRRMDRAGIPGTAVLAHPGYAATNSPFGGSSMTPTPLEVVLLVMGSAFSQSPAMGAQPTLMGATWPDAKPGMLFGPGRMGGMRGSPVVDGQRIPTDDATAAKLWIISEELTGAHFPA